METEYVTINSIIIAGYKAKVSSVSLWVNRPW